MGYPRQSYDVDGQAPAEEDINGMANTAGLSDDRLLAELIRLIPYDGTNYYKAIIPFATQTPAGTPAVTQQPTGIGGGGASILPQASTGIVTPLNVPGVFPLFVRPFRAIIGSRVGPSAVSTDPVDTSGPTLNWRDLRTAIFSASSDGVVQGLAVPASAIASNASGSPRIDLIYASLYVDQATNTTGYVKPIGTTQGQSQAVTGTLTTTVGLPGNTTFTVGGGGPIQVKTGTPGATPAIPTLPADVPASGLYYIPLAYLWVGSPFTSGTGIFTDQNIMPAAQVISLSQAFGGSRVGPGSKSTGLAALTRSTDTTTAHQWRVTGTRPQTVYQAAFGSETRVFLIDGTNAAGAGGPNDDAQVMDDSVDWRYRYFDWKLVVCDSGTKFPSLGDGTPTPPYAIRANATLTNVVFGDGQSFLNDSPSVLSSSRTAGVVAYASHVTNTNITGGAAIGMYVPLTGANAGNLMLYYLGTPGTLFKLTVTGSGAFENF